MTLDEFIAPMKAQFDRLDSNHDGVLEESELPVMPMHEGLMRDGMTGCPPEGPPESAPKSAPGGQ